MSPETLTGCPESLVGENRARSAACTATSFKRPGPDVATAEITFPVSSTTTSTVTMPAVLRRRALSGYIGDGKLRAIPLRTPPETGLSTGRGVGGGGSDSMLTVVASTFESVVPLVNSADPRPLSLSVAFGISPGSEGDVLWVGFELLLLVEGLGTTAGVLFSALATLLAGTEADVFGCPDGAVAGCEAG